MIWLFLNEQVRRAKWDYIISSIKPGEIPPDHKKPHLRKTIFKSSRDDIYKRPFLANRIPLLESPESIKTITLTNNKDIELFLLLK